MSPGIDQQALIAFLQDLVRAASVNRPQDGLSEAPAAAVVRTQMRRWGWSPIVEEAAPERPNVVAVLEGGRPGPTLLFEGHTDVVTEGDPRAWSHPPFAADIVDGRLYGRGAADMKAGIAAMLFAARAVQEAGFAGRLIVAALVDEEGMMLGVKDFVRRGRARGVDAAIVCEPEEREVCIAQKGAIRIRVTSRGRMAHGAMPQFGVNPLPAIARFVLACGEVQSALQAANGEHPHLGLDYLTPTGLAAGSFEQLNVIPGRAEVLVDIRTTPATDHAKLIQTLRDRLEPGMDLEVIDDRPPTETPSDHPIVRAVAAAHEHVYGEVPRLGGVPGSTDGTILWRDAGVPIVTYGPGGKWIAHQVDEYVEVEEVVRAAEVYAEAAGRFFKTGMEASSSRV